MRVLVAYDGSPPARAAISATATLFPGAEATVLTVREPEFHPVPGASDGMRLPDEVGRAALETIERSMAARAGATAGEGAALARDAGLRAEAAVEHGLRTWRAIEGVAERLDVELIACGTHGHGPVGRVLFGSTAASLLHHAPAPVLVVPVTPAASDGPVVVGYDGSPSAARALEFAAPRLLKRPAVVACVWRSPTRHGFDTALLEQLPIQSLQEFLDDLDDAHAEYARRIAGEGAARAQALGMPARPREIESGATAWRALQEVADEERAAVIVTGTDRDGVLPTALGSVATGLVHHAKAPVLVVPAR